MPRPITAAILAAASCHAAPAIADGPAYRMVGVVRDVETGQPVRGAAARVLIESETDPSRKVREGVTGEDGRYVVELPAGHGWTWGLRPPADYLPPEQDDFQLFATTEDAPTYEKDFEIRRGVPLDFRVTTPPGNSDGTSDIYLSISRPGNDCPFSNYGTVAADGLLTLAVPDTAGRYVVSAGDDQRTLAALGPPAIEFAAGFDPSDVVSKQITEGGPIVTDSAGRRATLTDCDADISGGTLTILLPLEARPTTPVRGRVVDADGSALADATVTTIFHGDGGSASSQVRATTDDEGRFELAVPLPEDIDRIGLSVVRDGSGGTDTDPFALDDNPIEVGPIVLPPEATIALRVVTPDGEPLHGVAVEPIGTYAARRRVTRTGPDGTCELVGLSPGVANISLKFGERYRSVNFYVDPGRNEPLEITLRPARERRTNPESESPRPALKSGTPAPPWSVAEWLDGTPRSLADYRGRVVVLDFWGTWCSACLNSVPALEQLHHRFADRDVAFIGIHTPEVDRTLVDRFVQQHEWPAAVAIDAGDDLADGETANRYAVHGFPTLLVIGRDGRIAFNGGDKPETREEFMEYVERIARDAGVPWPIDRDADDQEIRKRMTRLQVFLYARQIEAALANEPVPADAE